MPFGNLGNVTIIIMVLEGVMDGAEVLLYISNMWKAYQKSQELLGTGKTILEGQLN